MNVDDFQIRLYAPEDNPAVLHLHRVALEAAGAFAQSGPWDADLLQIEKVYFASGGTFLVGCIAERVVAMGAFKPTPSGQAEIKRMRVLPEFQGRGIGQLMLRALESAAQSAGYTKFVLDTTIKQMAAQRLYVKNGYREVRRTKEGFPLETIFFEKCLG